MSSPEYDSHRSLHQIYYVNLTYALLQYISVSSKIFRGIYTPPVLPCATRLRSDHRTLRIMVLTIRCSK